MSDENPVIESESTDLQKEHSEIPSESAEPLSRMETTDELAALAEEEKPEEVAPDIAEEAAALENPEADGKPVSSGDNNKNEETASSEQLQDQTELDVKGIEKEGGEDEGEGESSVVPSQGENEEKTNAESGESEDKPVVESGEIDTGNAGNSVEDTDVPASTQETEEKKDVEEKAVDEVESEEKPTDGVLPETQAEETVEEEIKPVASEGIDVPTQEKDQIPPLDTEEAASHARLDRKVSRARFEPSIQEEEELLEGDLEPKTEFEDMGRQSGFTEELEGGSEADIDEALPKISRQQLIESIQQHMHAREQLRMKNQNIQHKLALYFQSKRAEDRGGVLEAAGEGEQKYASLLSKYTDLIREKRILDDRSREQLDGLRERREQLRNDGESLLTQLREIKRTTVLQSVSSKTGKAPQWDEVEPQFALEIKKDADLHKLLIENIILRNRINKIEDTMKAKDKLGEGLHMIDFEQLKIENQTYNEKIEERNEDITKLRKKITTSVEVLTHVKEKLEFLRHENESQKGRLEDVDKTLAVKRSKVSRLKQSRDMLRNDNEKLRHSAGLLGKNELLRDFEEKVDEAELLRRRLADLQVTHAEVSMNSSALTKKINSLKAANPTLQTALDIKPGVHKK